VETLSHRNPLFLRPGKLAGFSLLCYPSGRPVGVIPIEAGHIAA
jgi:hypothetical protein